MADVKRGIAGLLISALAIIGLADVGEARITIRRHASQDSFFFHGNYSMEPFVPSQSFGLEIWNCASGEMPIFVADREPLIVCSYDAETGFTFADRVYAVEMPAGACVDHGRSCYYRNPDASLTDGGGRYFRVQYARRDHGNRVWLESYGDLSAADQARMLIVITIDGRPRAILEDTFTPLRNGGWFSAY